MTKGAQRQRTLFYSFASKDEKYRAELETHLAVLENSGSISGWHCRDINAGDDWRLQIDERLNSADVILLLVSDNFLASKYCWTIEAKRALERSAAGEAVTIPIILTDCDWENTPLARLQALPDNGKPITDWRPQNKGWNSVVKGIRRAVDALPVLSMPLVAAQMMQLTGGEEVIPSRPDDISKFISRCVTAFPPSFLSEPINEVELRRVIRPGVRLPPVFNHWRTLNAGVHWVDFAHLLLFRRLADAGFPIHLLIDDDQNLAPDPARKETETTVQAMFRDAEAHIHWYRSTLAGYDLYLKAALEKGFGIDAEVALNDATKTEFDKSLKHGYWLRYLVWLLGDVGRCIIYGWVHQRDIFGILRHVWSLEPAFIFGADHNLDGKLGKLKPPGDKLVVEPPHYSTILRWLEDEATPREARDLAKVLTLDRSEELAFDYAPRVQSLLDEHPRLAGRLGASGSHSDLRRAVLALLHAMCDWNERFFTPAKVR